MKKKTRDFFFYSAQSLAARAFDGRQCLALPARPFFIFLLFLLFFFFLILFFLPISVTAFFFVVYKFLPLHKRDVPRRTSRPIFRPFVTPHWSIPASANQRAPFMRHWNCADRASSARGKVAVRVE